MTTEFDEPRGRLLTRIAFALVLALIIIRSLMLEQIRDAGVGLITGPAAPGATTSLLLDTLSFVPALLVLARRLYDRSFALRGGIAHVLLLALALWATFSTAWADDRFLAFVSSTRLLAAASLFWTATQLVRRWDHLRLIAGLFVGLLLVNLAVGLNAQLIDQPEMKGFWQSTKTEFLQQHHWQADDYEAIRFEKKLLAGEFFGFNTSPNTFAAIVVMFAIVTVTAGLQRLRDRSPPALPAILFLVAASSAYLLANSGSKAAWAAIVLGLVLLTLWRLARSLLARQRLLAFIVAIALIGLAVLGVLGFGLLRGGLPTDSLNFRWRYWIGAWRIVLAHPGVGVGWSNFAEAYLPVRLPQAAEEIQDPHNFAIRVAVELGFVGLALLFAWLLTSAWRATRPIPIESTAVSRVSRAPVAGLALTLGITWLASTLIANDLGSVDFLVYDGVRRLVLIALLAAGVALVLLTRTRDVDDETDRSHLTFDGGRATWLLVGLVIALGLMLLQSAIDVGFFQIGPLMLVAVAAGATLGIGWRDQPARRESLPLIALIAGSIATLAFFAAGVVPIALAESRAADGTDAMDRHVPDVAGHAFASAYQSTFPLNNVDYASRAAEAFSSGGPAHRGEAQQWLTTATRADPSNAQAWFQKGRLNAWWRSAGEPAESPDELLADFAHGLSLNPSDAALQLEYADLLERFGRPLAAAAAIGEALRVDDALDPAEPERLDLRKPGEHERLAAHMAALSASVPTSQP